MRILTRTLLAALLIVIAGLTVRSAGRLFERAADTRLQLLTMAFDRVEADGVAQGQSRSPLPGGLTPEAMPQAGIFLRRLEKSDSSVARAAEESGLSSQDPTAKGVNEILQRLSETKRQPTTGLLLQNPVLHGLAVGSLNRLVVNFQGALKGDDSADVELQDGDEIVIPRKTQAAYVVGETASPFGTYKVAPGTSVKDLLSLAGGLTRNADSWNVRLLKADGRILDSWVNSRKVEPGDTVLVPQRIRRDSTWQENLNALTPIALILNAVK